MSHKVKPKRDWTESYFKTSLGHGILLLLALPLIPVMLSFGNDAPGFLTILTLSVFGPWAMTMLGVRSHRKHMDHHREYMNTHHL